MTTSAKKIGLTVCIILLSACGGGDGGDDDRTVSPPTPPPSTPPPTVNTCPNNDTLSCAMTLTGNEPFFTGTVNSANDRLDYARFTPSISGSASITLDNYGSNDLDLELRAANDLVIETSRSTVSPEEKITRNVLAGNVYYIVIRAFETGGLNSSYDLEITLDSTTTTPPPPPPPPPPPSSTVTMNFSITDGCNDGYFTRFKFYDVDNDLVWPNANTHYTTPGLGVRSTKPLACIPGAKICYGASLQADGGGTYWGIGLNGDRSCTNCCYTCTGGSTAGKNLTC